MRPHVVVLILVLFCVIAAAGEVKAGTLETRYATVVYDNDDLLRAFNDGVRLRGLSYLMDNKTNLTVADEVRNKVDIIAERVQLVLEMYVRTLKFRIVLLPSAREVRNVYRAKYGRDVDFISFFSPKDKTIYLSMDDVELRIFAHEVGHAVVDQYFKVAPPVKIHEMLAKYAESHLGE